jgi:hypothetical protein
MSSPVMTEDRLSLPVMTEDVLRANLLREKRSHAETKSQLRALRRSIRKKILPAMARALLDLAWAWGDESKGRLRACVGETLPGLSNTVLELEQAAQAEPAKAEPAENSILDSDVPIAAWRRRGGAKRAKKDGAQLV